MAIGGDRWAAYGNGIDSRRDRVLATIAILAAVAGVFMWAGMRPFGCDCVQIPFGSHQPGYTRVHAPLAVALHRLPARVVPPAAAGVPAGVYRNHVAVLLLYGRRSPLGVFKFSEQRPRPGARRPDIRAGGARIVELAPHIRGGALLGRTGPNSVTWFENGVEMMVIGPQSTFSDSRTIAAARAFARANR